MEAGGVFHDVLYSFWLNRKGLNTIIRVKKTISFAFILIFSVELVSSRAGIKSCKTDSDCIAGHHCHENICIKCLTCGLLFRQGNSCISDFNECGDCMSGYEEISITDSSSAIKPCKPVKIRGTQECAGDHDCRNSSYCYKSSCIECFDCRLFNRLQPTIGCARDLSECGACLNGFFEVAVTTVTHKKPCELDTKKLKRASIPVIQLSVATLAAGLFVIALLVFLLLTKTRQYKSNSTVLSKISTKLSMQPSAPPICVMEMPKCIKQIEGETSFISSFVKEEKQQAKIFQQPYAPYYWTEPPTDDLNEESSEASDDDINHSSWSPLIRVSEEDNSNGNLCIQQPSEMHLEAATSQSVGGDRVDATNDVTPGEDSNEETATQPEENKSSQEENSEDNL